VLDLREHIDALELFDLCYTPILREGVAPHYERVALPSSGGMEEQPARLMQELTLIEGYANSELIEDVKDYRRRRADQHVGSGTRNQD
jgi:hypothetical protein